MHNEALQLIRNASDKLRLELRRGDIKPRPALVNGPVDGDINHHRLQVNGEPVQGQKQTVSYKPVSFNVGKAVTPASSSSSFSAPQTLDSSRSPLSSSSSFTTSDSSPSSQIYNPMATTTSSQAALAMDGPKGPYWPFLKSYDHVMSGPAVQQLMEQERATQSPPPQWSPNKWSPQLPRSPPPRRPPRSLTPQAYSPPSYRKLQFYKDPLGGSQPARVMSPPSTPRFLALGKRPRSPPSRNKGLEMFLSQRQKLAEPEDRGPGVYDDTASVRSPPTIRRGPGLMDESWVSISAPSTPPTVKRGVRGVVDSFYEKYGADSDVQQTESSPSTQGGLGPTSITVTSVSKGSSTSPGPPTSPKRALWTPGQQHTYLKTDLQREQEEREKERERERERLSELKDAPQMWTPGGAAVTSPKKEFRPVRLDTSNLEKVSPPPLSPEESFAWRPPERTTGSATVTTPTMTTSAASPTSPTKTSFASWNGTISHFAETKSGLPPSQSPTITLLQRSREGRIPKGAQYMGSEERIEGDVKHTDEYYLVPGEKVTTTRTKKKKVPTATLR